MGLSINTIVFWSMVDKRRPPVDEARVTNPWTTNPGCRVGRRDGNSAMPGFAQGTTTIDRCGTRCLGEKKRFEAAKISR